MGSSRKEGVWKLLGCFFMVQGEGVRTSLLPFADTLLIFFKLGCLNTKGSRGSYVMEGE